jgi:hypothetical protein
MNTEALKPGFERQPTSGYIKKLTALESVYKRVKESLASKQYHGRVVEDMKAVLKSYGEFMTSDNYRAADPSSTLTEADALIAQAEEILNNLPN